MNFLAYWENTGRGLKVTDKKIVIWSPIDPCVEWFFRRNPSLPAVAEKIPYVFVCSNGIEELVRERCGDTAIIALAERNKMRHKADVAWARIRDMDFDICMRIDIDAIIFDLHRMLSMASKAGPKQLIGWKKKFTSKKDRDKPPYIRGACQAAGEYLVRNVELLGDGTEYDYLFSRLTEKMGGEIIDDLALFGNRFFELNDDYSGESPVWHPRKKNKKKTFERNARLWGPFK
jgi:hypothetical protein